MGAPLAVYGSTVHCERPTEPLQALDIAIPGDPSSAAFLAAAAAIVPDSSITIAGVGVLRVPASSALAEMGARIEYRNPRERSGEPVADLDVSAGELRGATFGGEQIVTMIDELPVLAVVATQAQGRTVIQDAGELRVKETDRIATTVSELRKMGAKIEPLPDGFAVEGPVRLMGGTVESLGDHRLAMALIVASSPRRDQPIYGSEVTADSFPASSPPSRRWADLEVRP